MKHNSQEICPSFLFCLPLVFPLLFNPLSVATSAHLQSEHGGGAHQEVQGRGVKLSTGVYTAFIKACGTSPGLVDAAHAAFKKMVWGPRRMKPNQVTFVTMMRVLREGGRPQDALDVYLGMRRAGYYQPCCTCRLKHHKY